MNLVPVRPPGPNSRKARAYVHEILQLRAQGYTFEAIREALAGAGVHVSNSTVQREVARCAGHLPAFDPGPLVAGGQRPQEAPTPAGAPGLSAPSAALPASPPVAPLDCPISRVRAIGSKEDAEAFFAAHDSNPLFHAKET